MQRIVLMRHAKSDWNQPGQDDKDRCLSERGRMAAPRMAHWLAKQDFIIDQVRSSSSARTRETWALVSKVLQEESAPPMPPFLDARFLDELYLATANSLWHQVEDYFAQPDGVLLDSTLMLLAHNPGLELLVRALSHQDVEFPTAAIAVFEREGHGPIGGLIPTLETKEWKLAKLQYPKQLAP